MFGLYMKTYIVIPEKKNTTLDLIDTHVGSDFFQILFTFLLLLAYFLLLLQFFVPDRSQKSCVSRSEVVIHFLGFLTRFFCFFLGLLLKFILPFVWRGL